MCLSVLEEMPKKLITTKHYAVYKRLHPTVHNHKLVYRPPYYAHFIYEPGKLNKINRLHSREGWKIGERVVERGFHAYRSKAAAESWSAWDEVIKPCIVPAGSEVFYGSRGEVVSNKLIVFSSIAQLNKWYANNPVT